MNIAMILAAGSGSRMGNTNKPKQFLNIYNKPLIVHTIEAFEMHDKIEMIIIVTNDTYVDQVKIWCKQFDLAKVKHIVVGGASRQESVYNGIKYLEKFTKDDDIVVLHDANRPLISDAVLDESIKVATEHGNALSVLPCNDAMFVSYDEYIAEEHVDKKILFQGQTPETFKFSVINDACERNIKGDGVDLSISALLLNSKAKVYLSKGSPLNFKITTAGDIDIFKALLATPLTEKIK